MAKNRVDVTIGAKNKTRRGLMAATEAFKNFGKTVARSLKRVTVGIVAATAATFGLTVMFLKAASSAEETGTKYAAVFSSIREEADATAEALAKDFGLASSTAKELLGDTGDILVGFGFTEQAALDLANNVNRLAIDLASFTNYSKGAAGASKALTKLLIGETEQAKALGIVVRAGSEEYKDGVKARMKSLGVSSLQAKALTAYSMALSQSQKAQGDYARTSGGLANTMRRLTQSWKTFREEVGLALNRSGAFNRLLDDAQKKLDAFRESVVSIIDVLSRSSGRKEVLVSMGKVITAALEVGGERIAAILKKAAPEIGKLIRDGVVHLAKKTKMGQANARAAELVQSQIDVRGQMKGEGKATTFGRNREEFTRRVKEMTDQLERQRKAGAGQIVSMKGVTDAEAKLAAAHADMTSIIERFSTSMPKPTTKGTIGPGHSSTILPQLTQDGPSKSLLSAGDIFERIYGGRGPEEDKLAYEKAMITLLESIDKNTAEGGLE